MGGVYMWERNEEEKMRDHLWKEYLKDVNKGETSWEEYQERLLNVYNKRLPQGFHRTVHTDDRWRVYFLLMLPIILLFIYALVV